MCNGYIKLLLMILINKLIFKYFEKKKKNQNFKLE